MWFDNRINGKYLRDVAGGITDNAILEFVCDDDKGGKQGTALYKVRRVVGLRQDGVTLRGRHLADGYRLLVRSSVSPRIMPFIFVVVMHQSAVCRVLNTVWSSEKEIPKLYKTYGISD